MLRDELSQLANPDYTLVLADGNDQSQDEAKLARKTAIEALLKTTPGAIVRNAMFYLEKWPVKRNASEE